MIAFFDTNVHVDVLRGTRALADVLDALGAPLVRLCPIVASELLRGITGRGGRAVERLVRSLVAIEPPSWRRCWLEAGRLLPRIFAHHEKIGIARLQNDVLLALTARHTGAVLVTGDAHFVTLRRHVSFPLKVLRQESPRHAAAASHRGRSTSMPPMYGRSGSGITTVPSDR
ncbi:MAG: PIN domain-containing protein [Deltaproteobacteria bacterium]|nr:PIN domain-containing protein [Deltaproteobacteria bacterium]